MRSRIDGIVARLHGLHPRLIDLSLDRLRACWRSSAIRSGAAAGDPCRRHQRQGQHLRLPARHGRGGGAARARLYLAASGALQRTHPHRRRHWCRTTRWRNALERCRTGQCRRADHRVRGDHRRRLPSVRADAGRSVRAGSRAGRPRRCHQRHRAPAACAITSISLDHRELLGDTLDSIAAEKAGIMKPGVPVAIGAQPARCRRCCWTSRRTLGAPVRLRGRDWRIEPHPAACAIPSERARSNCRRRRCRARSSSTMPASPSPRCARRAWRCRCGDRPRHRHAEWPARLQRLHGRSPRCCRRTGSCGWTAATIPAPAWCWPSICGRWADRPVHLVVGMKQAKDADGVPSPAAAARHDRLGGREPGQHARGRSRRSSRPPAVSPGRARMSPMRCARCRVRPGRRAC